MKKIWLLLISVFLFIPGVYANSIYSVNMDVYVDGKGDAYITETWAAYVKEGTELYHPYFNIGTSEITLIEANMDGKSYTIQNTWNVSASKESKAYKAGIYKVGNEVDICMGITTYGTHKYTFKYKISNFVLQASDADVVYWTLFPYDFSVSPQMVNIKIYSDFKYENTLDVWGYGNYGGLAAVSDGVILFESDGNLLSSEYMTILVKYPKGTFTTTNTTTNNFNHYYEMAQEGAEVYKENNNSDIFLSFIAFFIQIFPFLIFFIAIFKASSSGNVTKLNLKFGKTGNKVRKDVPNFRDIPCNKDVLRAYFVGTQYGIIKNQENVMGALILKWIRNGNVKLEKEMVDGVFKDKENTNIIFLNQPTDSREEAKLYIWMLEASHDGKLQAKEFERWCYSNHTLILSWFKYVLEEQKNILVSENKILIEEGKITGFKKFIVDPSMMSEAEQLLGLKKFLVEFSRIKEREAIEVQLWNEYLMFAQLFGIADKVAKQFKELYPEINQYIEQQNYDLDNMLYVTHISNRGVTSARRKRQQEIADRYSSGGGGFSSGGGGGGSFGGGGGGGGFR